MEINSLLDISAGISPGVTGGSDTSVNVKYADLVDGLTVSVGRSDLNPSQAVGTEETSISAMLSLKVNDNELIKRLLERGKKSGREDDKNETIISNRINEYNNKTAPLKEFYSDQNKLSEIEGIGQVEEITLKLNAVIDRL